MTDPNPLHAVPAVGADTPVDKPRIERAVREILEAIGEDPDRDGLLRTPARVAAMYEEIFSGLHEDPSEHLNVTFEANHDEMVMVRDIPLFSSCEHHLIPFHGMAHVAYIPGDDGRITGLSKIARLVEGYAAEAPGPGAADHPDRRCSARDAQAQGRLRADPVRAPVHVHAGCEEGGIAHRDVCGQGSVQGQSGDSGRSDQLHRTSRKSPLAEGFLRVTAVRCQA